MSRKFIELVLKDTGRKFSINPDLIVTMDSETDGTIIRTGTYSFKVEEKRNHILELVEDIKTRSKSNG